MPRKQKEGPFPKGIIGVEKIFESDKDKEIKAVKLALTWAAQSPDKKTARTGSDG